MVFQHGCWWEELRRRVSVYGCLIYLLFNKCRYINYLQSIIKLIFDKFFLECYQIIQTWISFSCLKDEVPESDRCIVGGAQNSLQSMLDLLTYIMGIIVSNPEVCSLLPCMLSNQRKMIENFLFYFIYLFSYLICSLLFIFRSLVSWW